MVEGSSTPAATPTDVAQLNGSAMAQQDIEMKDEASTEPHPLTVPAAPVAPASRPHTPAARGSPHPAQTMAAPPSRPNPHGSPVRVYLNQKVTPHLLEGMKIIAMEEPEKPLKWLSEFLEKKSKEFEG